MSEEPKEMMTHDPFQSYQTAGAYSGAGTPYGLPYTAMQPFINPAAFAGYGVNPQQLQGVFGVGQNPILQNPLLQNPLLQNPLLQNPLLQHALLHNHLQQLAWQNQLQNPALATHGWPQQQQPSGYPLAPQGLIGGGIGQPGIYGQVGYGQPGGFGQQPFGQSALPGAYGQPYGQIHPLAQLALRQAAACGISPFGGSF